MKINITAGECLNKILQEKDPNETFIPFNEALVKSGYNTKLFSEEFIIERSTIHKVSKEEYVNKLTLFLNLLKKINNYSEVILWFGDEPFCKKNTEIVLQNLKEYKFLGNVTLNIVNEETGKILNSNLVKL